MKLEILSDVEVRLSHLFEVPKILVYRAFTEGEYMRRWYASADLLETSCDIDFRVGGNWRIVQQASDGTLEPFRSHDAQIREAQRVVFTFVYAPGSSGNHPAVESVGFHEEYGKTLLVSTLTYDSKESRNVHLDNGLIEDVDQAQQRLEELLMAMV